MPKILLTKQLPSGKWEEFRDAGVLCAIFRKDGAYATGLCTVVCEDTPEAGDEIDFFYHGCRIRTKVLDIFSNVIKTIYVSL